jgi:hypothetical protein
MASKSRNKYLSLRRDAGCKMQDARCKMQDARCKMQDARCKMQDAGFWIRASDIAGK